MTILISTTTDAWVQALLKQVPYPYKTLSNKVLIATGGSLLGIEKIKGAQTVLLAGNTSAWVAPIARTLGLKTLWLADSVTETMPKLLGSCLSSIDHVVTPNKRVHAYIEKQYAVHKHMHTVYPPTIQTTPQRPRNELRIACDGSLGVEGGIGTILKAIQLTKEIIDEVKLYIGGSVQERARIEWLSKELGITQNVQCVPLHNATWVEPAHVYILPQHTQPFPLSLLHAMAAGSALIASDACIESEFITENKNALIYQHGDASRLSQALITLVRNPLWITQMGGENTTFAEKHFSQESFLRTLGSLRTVG